MPDNSLPDEIVSEILSPALKVPDEKFSDTSDVSPFTEYAESPSAYLLVCKSWLRVATPLLYSVVIIRSKAQAKALGRALSDNKELGQWVRHLRVEGGFGSPMLAILKAAPNITDLYLSLEIFASDNTVGLCNGLSLIQPQRLILKDAEWRRTRNKMVSQLVDALAAAIPKWQRLSVFRCGDIGSLNIVRGEIVAALAAAKKLQEITVNCLDDALHDAYPLFQDCPLQSIQVLEAVEPRTLKRVEWDAQPPSLKKFIHFKRTDDKELAPDSHVQSLPDPSLTFQFSSMPMSSEQPEVQDKIWSRILYFLLAIPPPPPVPGAEQRKKRSPRLPFLLVCKMFNRLGLAHYYTHVALDDHALHFSLVLSKNPSLGQHVRTIRGGGTLSAAYAYGSDDDSDDDAEDDSNVKFMSQLTALNEIYGCYSDISTKISLNLEDPLSWDAFVAATQSSGPTLTEISIPIMSHHRASPMVFSPLDRLRSLAWTCRADFSAYIPEQVPPKALSKLIQLRILTAHASFLQVLSLMELPSLRHVLAKDSKPELWAFLRVHGIKLSELDMRYVRVDTLKEPVLDVCPNLRSLTLCAHDTFTPNNMLTMEHLLSGSNVAVSLEKLKFKVELPSQKHEESAWSHVIDGLDSTRFPQLRQVQFTSCRWPKKERDIPKSYWVRWSEMLQKKGIHLADTEGREWRSRLK
ncbi:hypothetical protein FB45DRAFT_941062 [Roridomyces roridus]|uniref:Uncharacterized protein n=1 Tax=Roridomyces roridus TaxID=1738132 RepID=A0AAD7FD36_9AGAR|nr:hypothetical protein FB45DRAFT_941062 [Roridomyces roridus]